MNNTFDSIASLNRAKRAGAPMACSRLASVDTTSNPLPAGTPTPGELALATAFKPVLSIPPYFLKETNAAMGVTLVMATTTVVLPLVFAPSVPLIAAVSFSATAAVLGGYHWIFKQWGPSRITEERFEQAKSELHDSGDDHQTPANLLETLLLLGICTVDGALSGTALMGLFENAFTPKMAMLAAIAWGVAATVLLMKLVNAAAFEKACNDRREIVRNLSKGDAIDQAHAQAMKRSIGAKLGQDFSNSANKTSARLTLAVSVFVLAVGCFFMRAQPAADGAPAAAPIQQPVSFQTA